jgi:glucose uptake protein GlcU
LRCTPRRAQPSAAGTAPETLYPGNFGPLPGISARALNNLSAEGGLPMFVKAVALFTVAALIGLYMATQHFKGRTPPPVWAAVLHGLLAVSGAVVLLLGVMSTGFGTVHSWALVLFVVAALGGLYLVSFHIRRQPLPGAVVVIHGMVAAVAFLILVVAVFLIP